MSIGCSGLPRSEVLDLAAALVFIARHTLQRGTVYRHRQSLEMAGSKQVVPDAQLIHGICCKWN